MSALQLHFTSGINDVELSIELASTALHIATGYYFDQYGEPYAQKMGFKHQGYLKPGGALVMKVYEVRLSVLQELMLACKTNVNMASSVT
jgi:hypothetical protein